MLKKSKKTLFNLLVMGVTFTSCVVLSLCSVSFSSIFYVLIFGCVGLLLYAIGYIRDRGNKQ